MSGLYGDTAGEKRKATIKKYEKKAHVLNLKDKKKGVAKKMYPIYNEGEKMMGSRKNTINRS